MLRLLDRNGATELGVVTVPLTMINSADGQVEVRLPLKTLAPDKSWHPLRAKLHAQFVMEPADRQVGLTVMKARVSKGVPVVLWARQTEVRLWGGGGRAFMSQSGSPGARGFNWVPPPPPPNRQPHAHGPCGAVVLSPTRWGPHR